MVACAGTLAGRVTETNSNLRDGSETPGPRRGLVRDARLDTFRGLALVVMTGAHLPFPLYLGFHGWLGFATFTQVFIFLSGLVAGLVYAHRADEMSASQVWTKALRRSAWIWSMHVVVIALFTGYALLLHAAGSQALPFDSRFLVSRPGLGVALAAAMIYLPGYTNILPMYVFFVALLPATVLALRRGRWIAVLGTSLAVWLAAHLGLRDAIDRSLDDVIAHDLGFYDVFAWQFLFVGGVAVGVAWTRGILTRWRGPAWALIAALLVHAALVLVRHGVAPDGPVIEWLWSWSSRSKLGVLQLLDFGLVLVVTSWVARHHPRCVTWRWLALIGRHSMAVFLFHLIIVYLLAPLRIPQLPLQLVISALALASLTLPAWAVERRRARLNSPG